MPNTHSPPGIPSTGGPSLQNISRAERSSRLGKFPPRTAKGRREDMKSPARALLTLDGRSSQNHVCQCPPPPGGCEEWARLAEIASAHILPAAPWRADAWSGLSVHLWGPYPTSYLTSSNSSAPKHSSEEPCDAVAHIDAHFRVTGSDVIAHHNFYAGVQDR